MCVCVVGLCGVGVLFCVWCVFVCVGVCGRASFYFVVACVVVVVCWYVCRWLGLLARCVLSLCVIVMMRACLCCCVLCVRCVVSYCVSCVCC